MIGFIVANANHNKFRTWEAEGPAWTDKKKDAVVFLRRSDAEKVFAEDEDAWAILPVTAADLGEQVPEVNRCRTPAPALPYPPQVDVPIKIGGGSQFGYLICLVATFLVCVALILHHRVR